MWNISRRHLQQHPEITLFMHTTQKLRVCLDRNFVEEFKGAKFLMQILFEHNTVH